MDDVPTSALPRCTRIPARGRLPATPSSSQAPGRQAPPQNRQERQDRIAFRGRIARGSIRLPIRWCGTTRKETGCPGLASIYLAFGKLQMRNFPKWRDVYKAKKPSPNTSCTRSRNRLTPMSHSDVDRPIHGPRDRAGRARPCYTTMPNPRVGCVIVRDGAIVGTGWPRAAGRPHRDQRAAGSGRACAGATM